MKKLTAFASLAILATSCTTPLLKPARAYHNTVGLEYIQYIKDDPKLKESSKTLRIQTVKEFETLLKKAEAKQK